ncbi:MAG TPA: hypothetical protein VF712_19965 [Thermoleophilaceae bacterium]|jgi:hypothetical protein
MTNERIKRMLTLLATLAAAMMFAVGCGDDDDDGDNGGSGGADTSIGETSGSDAPKSKDEAIQRCYEEARKLEGDAKETAEASCRAAETGDTDEVKEKAKEQCVESVKQIPDEAARKRAQEECEKLSE